MEKIYVTKADYISTYNLESYNTTLLVRGKPDRSSDNREFCLSDFEKEWRRYMKHRKGDKI